MSQTMLEKGLEQYFQETVIEYGNSYSSNNMSHSIDKYASTSALHHLRVKTACMDSILRRERERHEQRQEHFRQRWLKATNNMRKIDVSITELEHVYKENIAETHRQTQLAAHHEELFKHKRLGLQRLRKEKALLTHVKNQTAQRLENFNPVQKYLTNVIDCSRGEFSNARDLIGRAKLLLGTRSELVDRNDAVDEHLRRQEQILEKTLLVKSNEVILLNNYIFELGQNLSDGREMLRKIEDEVARVKTTASHRTIILAQIKTAAYNIYVKMCASMKVHPKIKPEDTIKQLAAVKASMLETKNMDAMIRSIIKKAKARAAAEKAEAMLRKTTVETTVKDILKHKRNEAREVFGLRALTLETKPKDNDATNRLIKRKVKDFVL